MLIWWEALLGVFVTAVLAGVAIRVDALTPRAGLVGFAFGSVIVVTAGFAFLALLALFLIGSVGATRYRFEEKQRKNLQEGTKGERGVANVASHILVPSALALGSVGLPSVLPPPTLAVLFVAALAFGSADTFASEFGVLAGRARSIVSGKPVPPGTNGGISLRGETWALIGAVTTATVGLALLLLFSDPVPRPLLLVGVAALSGFVGCQIDSVLGELLENRGALTKGGTNLASMLATVGIASALLLGVGA
ncbi:MAG: DUF92 domain-containing protein [Thermoplasmata archaeon]|nr:DUF92 domain-containing protein [Thermoplasmata archaeon]